MVVTEPGFEKASSDNLPMVDGDMVNDFFVSNPNFFSAEVKNVKTTRAQKASYSDNAVGYVQIKKENHVCTILGTITPEHKVRQKGYSVEAVVDMQEEKVTSCECKDCAASKGGCKHGIAFLLWLHRRSEEPAVTSVKCYWKKSALAKIGDAKMDLQSLVNKRRPPFAPRNGQLLEDMLGQAKGLSGNIFLHMGVTEKTSLSMFQLILTYKENEPSPSPEGFIEHVRSIMTDDLCREAERSTVSQSKSTKWYELRFGRITASKIYEASRSKTKEGSLVEAILGGAKNIETDAIRRGLLLESQVISQVEKLRNIKINNSGLLLHTDYPFLGASPDGISSEYCIEVKCPSAQKNIVRYVENQVIKPKYFYQLQLQMLFAKKSKGLFCVAAPNFEETKEVNIFEVEIDEEKCLEIISFVDIFWKTHIFPVMIKM